MEDLIKKVKRFVRTLSVVFLIIETTLSLLVGGLIGSLIDTPTNPSPRIIYLIISLFMFVLVLAVKVLSQIDFPAAAVEELQARCELDKCNKDIARKRTIDGYIETAIQSLNMKTCTITPGTTSELCRQSIEDGVRSVIGPVIDLPNYILDCNRSHFTVAAYLTYSAPVPREEAEIDILERLDSIFVLRDDLELGNLMPPNLLEIGNAVEASFDIQTAILRTLNHKDFSQTEFLHGDNEYTIIVSPIPQVCESECLAGTLCIITKTLDTIPEDTEGILLIFGRIISNWLSKYDECVFAHFEARGNKPTEIT